ncbi:MAG: SoxR reducing system RseC family protein [Ignavibacterium sp.]|nr:SoxR reducing system RseC family protein [Ignavibacterium sp.]
MYNEELVEEGIVKLSNNGIAEVIISNSGHCEECSAKIYCKPGNSSERTLIVRDPFGAKAGDKVRVVIKGSKILSASFLIYGIPLILLLLGIFIGHYIFNENKELYSTLLGFSFIIFYSIFFLLFFKKHKLSSYPEITFVSSKL